MAADIEWESCKFVTLYKIQEAPTRGGEGLTKPKCGFLCALKGKVACAKAHVSPRVCGSYGPGRQASLGERCHRVLR